MERFRRGLINGGRPRSRKSGCTFDNERNEERSRTGGMTNGRTADKGENRGGGINESKEKVIALRGFVNESR